MIFYENLNLNLIQPHEKNLVNIFIKQTLRMIAETLEGLCAFLHAQRMLSLKGRDVNISTVVLVAVSALVLAIVVDYSYMIYLHYKMVTKESSNPFCY